MNTLKNPYQSPQITKVVLDKEISLVLNSEPPFGPGELFLGNAPDYFNNNPQDQV
jgi:hypothetical protein